LLSKKEAGKTMVAPLLGGIVGGLGVVAILKLAAVVLGVFLLFTGFNLFVGSGLIVAGLVV